MSTQSNGGVVIYGQQDQLGLSVPSTATVIGTGGTGAWAAIFLAMTGVGRLVLFDPSDVSREDLARLPFPESDLGQKKVDAVRRFIGTIRPNAQVVAHSRPFELSTDGRLLESPVFVAADGSDVHNGLLQYCTENSIPCASGTYAGLNVFVLDHAPASPLNVTDAPVPCWVGSGVCAAIFAVQSKLHTPINVFISPQTIDRTSEEMEIFAKHFGVGDDRSC